MDQHELTDEEALHLLYDDAAMLYEVIEGYKSQINRHLENHNAGGNSQFDILMKVHNLHEAKENSLHKLGRVSVLIEQYEERVEAQRASSLEQTEQAKTLAVVENHLDWFEVELKPIGRPSDDGAEYEPERDRR